RPSSLRNRRCINCSCPFIAVIGRRSSCPAMSRNSMNARSVSVFFLCLSDSAVAMLPSWLGDIEPSIRELYGLMRPASPEAVSLGRGQHDRGGRARDALWVEAGQKLPGIGRPTLRPNAATCCQCAKHELAAQATPTQRGNATGGIPLGETRARPI